MALGAFYTALSIGTMSIVAPISATGVALPVIVGLIGGVGLALPAGAGSIGPRAHQWSPRWAFESGARIDADRR